MIFLIALFTISAVGISVLLVSKYLEVRRGKAYFSPAWLRNKDEAIEHATHSIFRSAHTSCVKCAHASWRHAKAARYRVPEWLRQVRTRRFKKSVQHNGGGSVYLKQLSEHKEAVRNGENNVE